MECPSCGFQNLPGLQQCGRCHGTLRFDDVNVHPYRAGEFGASWRNLRIRRRRGDFSLAAWLDGQFDAIAGCPYRLRARDGEEISLGRRCVWGLASIIPGLGQIRSGRRRRGYLLMLAWFLSLLGFFLFMSAASVPFGGLVLALHAYGILDSVLYGVRYMNRGLAVYLGLVVYIGVVYGLYGAAGWVQQGLVRLDVVGTNNLGNTFQAGDVIALPGRWTNSLPPEPGDVVAYNTRGINYAYGHGHGPWFVPEGILIDRILAGPGDRVVCSGGSLTVNGKPLPRGRGLLVSVAFPEKLDLVVPSNTYFIYPTLPAIRCPRGMTAAEIRLRISLVRADEIRGRIRMIVNPLDRIRSF